HRGWAPRDRAVPEAESLLQPPGRPGVVSRSRIAALALVVSLGAVVVLAWTYDRVRPGDAGRRQLWGLGQANYHEFREKLGARKLPGAAPILILGRGRPAPGAVTAAPAGGAFDGPVTVT